MSTGANHVREERTAAAPEIINKVTSNNNSTSSSLQPNGHEPRTVYDLLFTLSPDVDTGLEIVEHDVIHPYFAQVDQVFPLACPASPPHYQKDPVKTIETCTLGTLNMLRLAQKANARFMLVSTSEIYGDPLEHPQKETYWGNCNPIGPRACYDEGKRLAETLTYAFATARSLQVRVVRPFNTFGPRMNPNDGRVVSNFITQALRGDDLTIYGEGEQTRSFQYVPDLVDGFVAVMEGDCAEPINLGNPEEYTVRELAEMVRRSVNEKVRIVNKDANVDDPQKRKPDISRAKERVGWQPRHSFKYGLEKTVEFF
ncbi:UDP-glucuronate decarboxylase [Fimicolochytrium jonesii]|uniref:UDP-glucuronate decarboxylase n=1 Tax=Fimicolochytrium jonesii TaxID=1396493 RepID=UPI0022FDFA6E|nr:UDP-glucuronate decarboxylase [Fimicolochytrium jonesii]KAI8825762.1 UDP-glucuronate decarboxylase [Fimicolochytrium jonesii]